MKINVYVIDFEVPARFKRLALRIGIPLALLLGGGAIAYAGGFVTWSSGQTLNASDLNENFTYLQDQITALQTDAGAPIVTAWQSYTPSFTTADGAAINNSQVGGTYRRVGDSMEFTVRIGFTGTSGSSSSEQWEVTLPPGVVIDASKLAAPNILVANGQLYNNSVLLQISASTAANGTGLVFGLAGQGGNLSTAYPATPFTAGTVFTLVGTAPVAGWGVTR